MKIIISLLFLLTFTIHSESQKIEDNAKDPNLKTENSSDLKISSEKTKESKEQESKIDFNLSQYLANDINFRGLSIYGEKLSRRNQESYKSFSDSWFVSTNITFHLPLPGLKFLLTSNNPYENRSNKDADLRFQNTPGGEEQIAKVNRFIQTGVLDFDPNALKPRKEQNGLRDVFFGQLYYDWDTKIGGFKTGLFFLNNQNYPAKFNFGEWVFGFKPDVLKILNPELVFFYRFTSESNGLNNGNVHTRIILKHEFFKEEFFRFTPILESGYQASNNTIDKRNGISDITTRLQFFFGYFLLGLNATHRPNLYLYDNDRNYPKIGGYNDINPEDGRTVDPSRTAGIINKTVLDSISHSNAHEVAKQYATRNYQEQHIVKNIFIIHIGYTAKF